MLYNIITQKTIPEILFAHIYSCPSYQRHFKATAPNIEIAFIEAGDLKIEVLGKQYTVPEKSFLVLPHGYNFTLKGPKGQTHIHYTISARMDSGSSTLKDILGERPKDSICVPIYLKYCSKTEELVKMLNSAIKEFQKDDTISRYKCGAIFVQLLCEIAGADMSDGENKSSPSDVLDKRIKKYIEKNINAKITLSDIADCVGKNANYLNQVFKKKNNMSIISYVNLMKMRKIALLISEEKMTIKEASKEVGINDANYISRMFKLKMGMTVSEFKANSADYTFSLSDME